MRQEQPVLCMTANSTDAMIHRFITCKTRRHRPWCSSWTQQCIAAILPLPGCRWFRRQCCMRSMPHGRPCGACTLHAAHYWRAAATMGV